MKQFARWTAIAAAALLPGSAGLAMQPPQLESRPALEQFRTMVTELRTTMLTPGERVANWDVGGANPDADLRARGADRYYLQTRGDDGDSVSILTDRPISELAPEDWEVVDSFGSSTTPLDNPQVDFTALSARYVIAIRSRFERRGDVDCSDGIVNALLYELPDAPEAGDDNVLPLMFRALILALEGQQLCVRADGDAASGYRSRVFLPDGRLLPELTDDDVSHIVPAAPIDRLVHWRQAPPEAQPSS